MTTRPSQLTVHCSYSWCTCLVWVQPHLASLSQSSCSLWGAETTSCPAFIFNYYCMCPLAEAPCMRALSGLIPPSVSSDKSLSREWTRSMRRGTGELFLCCSFQASNSSSYGKWGIDYLRTPFLCAYYKWLYSWPCCTIMSVCEVRFVFFLYSTLWSFTAFLTVFSISYLIWITW